MTDSGLSRRVGTPLRLRRNGAIHQKHLLIGALALIIVVSLGATVWRFLGGRSGGPGLPEKLHFRCLKCNEEFTAKTEEVDRRHLRMGGLVMINCAKCGRKESAIMMSQCPKCGKYYVPSGLLRSEKGASRGGSADICEHCGLDVEKYQMEEFRKLMESENPSGD